MLAVGQAEIETALVELVDHLHQRLIDLSGSPQLQLFENDHDLLNPPPEKLAIGESVDSLQQLVDKGRKYPTIYADPPWSYANEASWDRRIRCPQFQRIGSQHFDCVAV